MKIYLILLALSLAVRAANLLPNGSFEHGADLAWNRMHDLPYLPDQAWKQDDTLAFHGKYSLAGDGSAPLLIPLEANPRKGCFSIYVQSDAPFEVLAEAFAYTNSGASLQTQTTFQAGSDWRRLVLKVTHDNNLRSSNFGPMFIRLTGKGTGILRFDAAQYEYGQVTPYTEWHRPDFPATPEQDEGTVKQTTAEPLAPGTAGPLPAPIAFSVASRTDAPLVPVSVVLPFARGARSGTGPLAVRTADGLTYPAQSSVLATWPRDGSCRALLVHCQVPLAAGQNNFTAVSAPAQTELPDGALLAASEAGFVSRLASPVLSSLWRDAQVIVKDITDQTYHARLGQASDCRIVENGPLYAVLRLRDLLVSDSGEKLGFYVAHLFFHRDLPGFRLELSFTNPQTESILVIKTAKVLLGAGTGQVSAACFTGKNPSDKFSLPLERFSQIGSGKVRLLIAQPAERHPTCLEEFADGSVSGYLWPEQCRPLILTPGQTILREFTVLEGDAALAAFTAAPVALASPAELAATGFLTIPFGVLDEGKYPYISSRLKPAANDRYGRESTLNKDLLGMFNYGDIRGDGGWANLESFLDFSSILRALVFNDLDALEFAFDRAVHYRDVDTIRGSNHYHFPNHNGGSTDTSHAWPQGYILHFLLTGSPRSQEVVRQTMERALEIPVDAKGIYGARSLSRYLLMLVDLYGALGDARLRDRFFAQVKYATAQNLGEDRHDDTLFPWGDRLDPYQVWYGACAFMQMYNLTGDEICLQEFRREMDASLNRQFFFLDLRETWPNRAPEELWPIQLGFHSRHRGALIYPLLVFRSQIENNDQWLALARKACYADYHSGTHRIDPMDIMRAAIMQGQCPPEDDLRQEAAELVLSGAAPALLNGDFSLDPEWFRHWHLPASRQMGFDEAVKEWPLTGSCDVQAISAPREKLSYKVSPWRYYSRLFGYLDRDEFYLAPPSLRVWVTSKWALGRSTWAETAKVRLEPGKWCVRGAYKLDENAADTCFGRLTFFHPGEDPMWLSFNLKAAAGEGVLQDNGLQSCASLTPSVSIIETQKPGWREFALRFENRQTGIATLRMYLYLHPDKQDALVHLDDFSLERLP
ncbi:MAG: hypothetical protein GX902_08750 [Lentisphaerae bacterium]|nr:hypothetical protein [Lentisphaerota bacterium]